MKNNNLNKLFAISLITLILGCLGVLTGLVITLLGFDIIAVAMWGLCLAIPGVIGIGLVLIVFLLQDLFEN